MNVRKTIKKIVALGTGATMVGATMMGAAAQLEDYPSQMVSDGAFDGQIVVGQDAATSDVVGAIDIAASLQAASTQETSVDVPGAAGRTTVQGDAVEIGESGDLLSINEPIGDVKETLTEFELNALQGGVISTDEGTTAYKQYLRFKTANGSALFPTAVTYGENDAPSEEVGDFLFIAEDQGAPFFEWQIEFEEGLESSVENSELDDYEDEVFNIFGTDYVFVDSQLRGNESSPDLTLEFIAGDVTDVLQEGETKTYTIDGKDYEVTLVFVSDPSGGDSGVEAKLSVNGELTDALTDGDTDILADGLEVGIQEILVNNRGGIVEFFLGAQKVQFRDGDTSNEDFAGGGASDSGGVEITEEDIEDARVSIEGQTIDGAESASEWDGGEEFEITSISYRLAADAVSGTTDIFVPPGQGVREFLDEPEGMLSPNFDIRYEGFLDVGETPIEISAQGDDEYKLRVTNRQGNSYEIPYVEVDGDDNFRFGEDGGDALVFNENPEWNRRMNNATDDVRAQDFQVGQDDFFVVTDADDNWDDQAFSHVLSYQSIDTSQQTLTFEDLATGTKELTYKSFDNSSFQEPSDNLLGQGKLIVGGNQYQVYISDESGNPLAIDLNGDGDVGANSSVVDEGRFTVRGGGVIDFDGNTDAASGDVQNTSALPANTNVSFVLHTPSSEFDETNEGGEELTMRIFANSDNEVDMDFDSYNRVDVDVGGGSDIDRTTDVYIEGVGVVSTSDDNYEGFKFEPTEPEDQDDNELEMTDFGVMYDFYNPSGDQPSELTLMYPHSERGAQVFVTGGQVTTSSSSGSDGGGVTSTQVNPIAVGLAVLDVDAPAVGSTNMISVGGPCINRVSAELLGAEYPACGDAASQYGFEDGMATIRLYEDQNALLVAGYGSQETLGASYVLADYQDYNLSGSEVEVTVADLDSISVSPVE